MLRGNKDSVMAMLEAFVHDPLINWRLLNTGDNLPDAAAGTAAAAAHPQQQQQQAVAPDASGGSTPSGHSMGAMVGAPGGGVEGGSGGGEPPPGVPADLRTGPPSPPRRDLTREQVLAAYGGIGDATEVLNERAVAVMKRMSDKLTGRDAVAEGMVAPAEPDSVAQQVQRLIALATSNEALCQSYIGEGDDVEGGKWMAGASRAGGCGAGSTLHCAVRSVAATFQCKKVWVSQHSLPLPVAAATDLPLLLPCDPPPLRLRMTCRLVQLLCVGLFTGVLGCYGCSRGAVATMQPWQCHNGGSACCMA